MSGIKRFLILLVITLSEGFHVHVDHFELCDKEKQPITFDFKVKDDGDKQILEYGLLETTVDLNNDITNTVTVYKYIENDWHVLISKSNPVCTMVSDIMGVLAENLEKSAGMTKGCPYPKGKYEVKNHLLDYNHFKSKELPAGKNKIRSEFFTKNDKKRIGCYEVEFTIDN